MELRSGSADKRLGILRWIVALFEKREVFLRVAVVINAETAPDTVQEQPCKRGRQTRMSLLAQRQGGPEIHEPAGVRLDV